MKTEYLVIAVLLAVPVLLIRLAGMMNKKRKVRYEQSIFPWVALAYAVICCVLFEQVQQLRDFVISLPLFAGMSSWLSGANAALFDLNLLSAYLLCMLVLAGYVLVKGIVRLVGITLEGLIRLFSREKKNEDELPYFDGMYGPKRLYWLYLNIFYRIEEGYGTIRGKWLAVGKLFHYAANGITALYLLMLVFGVLPLFGDMPWYPYAFLKNVMGYMYLWPPVAMVVLREIAYFLDGMPARMIREEAQDGSFSVVDPAVDYSGLIPRYMKQFAERFVSLLHAANYPVRVRRAEPQTEMAASIKKRLENSQTKEDGRECVISESVLECITALPNRENALIDAVLTEELGECLMLYANVLLARGENLLVLCEDEQTCLDVKQYIKDKLTKINLFAPVWMVQSVDEMESRSDCDVLVLMPHQAIRKELRSAKQEFFSHVTTVLMINSTRLLSETPHLLTMLSGYLENKEAGPIQYICLCNGISGELRMSLEQLLSPGREFRPYECYSSKATNQILLWNYEAGEKCKNLLAQQNLFGAAMDHVYLGVALPLALMAARYDVENISVMGRKVPRNELQAALRTYYSKMREYMPAALRLPGLMEKLQFNRIDAKNPFVIVMDEEYCLPMTLRNYARLIGGETSMVHIVSKPYMLRDYFAAHAMEYLQDQEKTERFAPILTDTTKMMAVKLITQAENPGGLDAERMLAAMQDIDESVTKLGDALALCCRLAWGEENADRAEEMFFVTTENVYAQNKHAFVSRQMVHLSNNALSAKLLCAMEPARARIGEKEIFLGFGQKDVTRYYLPDQVIVIDGNVYFIDDVDPLNGIIWCGRRDGDMRQPVDYFQHRRYTVDLSRENPEGTFVDLCTSRIQEHQATGYTTTLYRHADVGVETLGFFAPAAYSGKLNLTDNTTYRALPQQVQEKVKRFKRDASVLSLRFHGVNSEWADGAAFTLAVLLSEMMKTFFPSNWPCIAVCPVIKGADFFHGSTLNQNLGRLYPQVQLVRDDALPQTDAEVLIVEDSENETGILEALCRNRNTPFNKVFSLLLDYLRWQREMQPSGNIRGDFLCYGGKKVPEALHLALVEVILMQMENTDGKGAVYLDETQHINYCYYCHKHLKDSEKIMLKDENGKKDRPVCRDCKKRLISKKPQLMRLYQQVRTYLEDTYGIQFSPETKVHFVSSATLKKIRGETEKRAMGLGGFRNAWIETNAPKETILSVLAHELTHVWQHENIRMEDERVYEGHATYVQVQFLRWAGYTQEAEEEHHAQMRTNNEYGQGYANLVHAMESYGKGNCFDYMIEHYGLTDEEKQAVIKQYEKNKK